VFLDEIAEASLEAQAALLRVVEDRVVRRLGSERDIRVNVRIIAATHGDLAAMCDKNAFRKDLYYRLAGETLRLVPLRGGSEDIEPLANHFLRLENDKFGSSLRGFAPDAIGVLTRYAWPGNVRELKNAVGRAAVFACGDTITVEDLPEHVRHDVAP